MVQYSFKPDIDGSKETAPLDIFTHCHSHCLNLSVAATSEVQEVRNLICITISEV